eukprot:7376684-Prymnesium_polylepis.1
MALQRAVAAGCPGGCRFNGKLRAHGRTCSSSAARRASWQQGTHGSARCRSAMARRRRSSALLEERQQVRRQLP